jgi:tellurite resistance-related uncharacterized protein
MSNFYGIANETLDKFLTASGDWSENTDDAEHVTIEAATEKQLEFVRQQVITELVEIPLMQQEAYDAINSRTDDLQARLEAAGVDLVTNIGHGDDTTWTMTFRHPGLTLTLKLTGPDDFEVQATEN